jgi:polyferredoxin
MQLTKLFLAIVTFMIIATQTVNSYYVIDSFSKIEGKLRIFQNIMFCSIVSIFILIMVFMERHEMALAGAIFEFLLNIYSYFQEFWQDGYKHGKGTIKRRESIVRFWRQNWFKILTAMAIPAIIYACSYFMAV